MKKLLLLTFAMIIGSVSYAQVVWSNLQNVTIQSDNSLTKNSQSDTWNAGASSVNKLATGQDGFIEFQVMDNQTNRFIGLSESDTDTDFISIDFSIYLYAGKTISIYENFLVAQTGSFSVGDIFKIERVNNTVKYYQNNQLIYTSIKNSNTDLIVDVSIKTINASISPITISPSFQLKEKWAFINGDNINDPIFRSGKVMIGTNLLEGSHQLTVEGSIGSRSIKVEATGWSDFVFASDYKLLPLEKVEEFINENQHLPEVPSEAEVLKNGINLGEMDAKLLQKIEELTLYLINQNKEIEALKKELIELKNQ